MSDQPSGEDGKQQVPASTGSTADVTISRPSRSQRFGMLISRDPCKTGGHYVDDIVEGGMVDAFNKTNPPRCVRKGDLIKSVNGKTTFDDMMGEFRDSLEVALKLWEGSAAQAAAPEKGSAEWQSRRARVTAALIPGLKKIVDQEFGAGASMKINRVEEMYVRIGKDETFEDDGENGRRYAPGYISGLLPVAPFHNLEEYPWVQQLQSKWKDIRDELRRSLDDKHWTAGAYASSNEAYGKDWKIMGVLTKDTWQDEVRFKVTSEVVKQLQGFHPFEAFFARMPPNTTIAPHSDNLNYILTCHLALELDEGLCAIKVGNEERLWKPGEVMILDTCYIHSTRNDSPSPRFVLVLRFWHPGLSDVERRALHLSQAILASTGAAK